MKYYLLTFLLLLLFSGCTINESTGMITISNHSALAGCIVTLDNTQLANVSTGYKTDYWFYQNLKGDITVSGADEVMVATSYDEDNGVFEYKEQTKCEFLMNHRYQIRVTHISVSYYGMTDDQVVAYIEPGIKNGATKGERDFYHYPGE